MTRLERYYRKMEIGEIVFINCINATLKEIDFLRSAIKEHKLEPVDSELRKFSIVESYIPDFLDGTSIMPQMYYRRIQ